jgi:hypothetical protein
MQREWNTVKTVKVGNFDVEIAWCYEDLPLSYVFETAEDIKLHQRRCEDYTDTHYVARVLALYDSKEMGSDYLGSCYAYGCDPSVDIENGISGYLDQMIETAVSEAQDEAVKMLDRLKADFLS